MTLQRRSPLAAGTRVLSRRTGLARRGELSRGTILRSRGTGPVGSPGPQRDSHAGEGPTLAEQQARCRDRDRDRCVRCGRPAPAGNRQHQHRDPRGIGGRPGVLAHRLSGLVLLCGWSATDPDGCHNAVESYRDQAREDGYLVPKGVDPAEWPIVWFGSAVLLDDEGGVTPCGPPQSV